MDESLTHVLLEARSDKDRPGPARDMIAAMDTCINKLPQQSRELLRSRYENNEKAHTLAQRFKKTAGSVRQALLKIRRAVQRCIEAAVGEVSL
jgi:DNA-directed RNA polymerase specialized sigma24 family protein